MKLSFRFAPNAGWVFSPKIDISCFSLPFLACFFFNENYFDQSYLGFFLTKILFAGHIFVTPIPLTKAMSDARDNRWKFFILPAIYVATYLYLIYYDFIIFRNFVCVSILIHNFYQHLSWGRISVAGNKFLLNYARILVTVPLVFWFFNQLPSVPHYLYRFTLTEHWPKFDFSRELFAITIAFHLLSAIFSFSYDRQSKVITLNAGRLHYFMATTFWLTYGLFYTPTVAFFLYYLNISHGFGYLIYVAKSWPNHKHIPKWESNYKVPKLAIASIIGGSLWMASLWASHTYPSRPFVFMAWFPLIMHFAFDSYLWSKQRLSAIQA